MEDGEAYARQMGHAVLDSFNPLNKKSAYDTGKTAANIGAAVVPGVEELNALRGLKAATTVADEGVVAARAAAERVAGTPGQAAAEEALRAAEARQAAAPAAYQAKLPGLGARKMAAKAKAAGAKAKERRMAGRRDPNDPLAPHTDASRAKAKADEAQMHGRWQQQGRGAGQGQPVLAHASDAPSGNHTPAIGKPSMSQMATGNPNQTGFGIASAKGVEIVDAKGSTLGEFDEINNGQFIEDKSAKGLNTPHPKTGLPVQTAEQWANKQIYSKSVVRIDNLAHANATRPTVGGTPSISSLGQIKGIKDR